MIEIVKSPSSNKFYSLVKESRAQLLLCAPYISLNLSIQTIITQKRKLDKRFKIFVIWDLLNL